MSDGKYLLLDTSAVIALLREVRACRNAVSKASEVFASVITYAELLYGAERAANPQAYRRQTNALMQRTAIIPCTVSTAGCYARLKAHLAAQGTPIPENDIWIAAVAQQHELAVLTSDRHFQRLAGWIDIQWIR